MKKDLHIDWDVFLEFLQAREVFVRVKHGFSYLLRLINANAHNCPILLSAYGHSLRVLAADGNPVQSMTGTHVVLFPGNKFHILSRFFLILYPSALHDKIGFKMAQKSVPVSLLIAMQNCIAFEFNKF